MLKTASWIVLLALAATLGAMTPPNLEDALEEQLVLATETPGDPTIHNDLGNLLMLARDFAAAEAAYRRALEIDVEYADAWFNLGLLLEQTDRGGEALDVYRALIDLEPTYAWAHYRSGALLHDDGNERKAIESYARAFALDTSLTFAEVNPHIIDNALFTQSLLLASDYEAPPVARTPRRYAEAGRIRGVMLEPLVDEVLEAAGMDQPMDGEVMSDTTGRTSSRSGNSMELGRSGEVSSTTSGASSVGREQVTRDDLEPTSRSRGVTGVAVAVPTARSGGTASGRSLGATGDEARREEIERARSRRRTSDPPPTVYVPPQRREATGGQALGGSTSSSEPASRRRYRPGRDSTASLELRLEPSGATGLG